MAKERRKRRWLQFRLRTIFMLILAFGLWLGYEVNWASRQQRHVAAIRKLGGTVEFEPRRWSPLKLIDNAKYGVRAVKAEIPGVAVDPAIPHLQELPRLREVRVVYDGTCNLYPGLDQLRAKFPEVAIRPAGRVVYDFWELLNGTKGEAKELTDRAQQVLQRLRTISTGDAPRKNDLLKELDFWSSAADPFLIGEIQTGVVPLSNGLDGEVIWFHNGSVGSVFKNDFREPFFAILLVRDRIVDWKTHTSHFIFTPGHEVKLEDVDGDGKLDLAIRCLPPAIQWIGAKPPPKKLPGDSRMYLDAYRIDARGLHSIFPEPVGSESSAASP